MLEPEETKWVVYIHTFPNNKKYVGITSMDATIRWGKNGCGYRSQKIVYRAIQKYGWDNIKHEIVMHNLTEDEACKVETALIKELNTTNRDYGYNVLPGGKSMPITDRSKPVICLSTLEVFKSEREAAEKLGVTRGKIGSVCNGTRQHCGKDKDGTPLKFAHYEKGKHYEKYVYEKPKIDYSKRKHTVVNRKPVICLNNLRIFDSLTDASKYGKCNVYDITRVCNKERVHAGIDPETKTPLSWSFYDESKNYEKVKYVEKIATSRDIICTNTLEVYPSVKSAGDSLGVSKSGISVMCNNPSKTSIGLLGKDGYLYHFEYYDVNKQYVKRPLVKKYPSVECITLNKQYISLKDAIKDTGIRRCFILDMCNGLKKEQFSKNYNTKLMFRYLN